MTRRAPYLAGASALAAALWPLGMWAQIAEEDGGARLVGNLDMRVEFDDNETTFRTGFDVDLISATRTQRLSFSTDVGLELDLEDFDTSWSDPRYQLDYLRDNGQLRLSASALYQRSDVDGQAFDLSTEFDETDLIEDDGTREVRQLNLGLEFGMQDPFGGTLSYNYSDTIYADTADPDLFDIETSAWSGSLRFDIDPTLRVSLDGSYSVTEEDNALQERTETARLGLNANWQIRPDIALEGRLGYNRTEQEQTFLGTPFVTVTEGAEGRLAATLTRPNGTLGLSWDSSLNSLGRLDTLQLTRQAELPRGRTISAMAGVTFLPTGPEFAIGSLSYTHPTQTGEFTLSANRSATVSALDQEVVRTNLSARYAGDLPNGANWSISGTLIDSDFQNPANPDIQATQLSLRYAIPLTEDWNLSTGASWRETREAGMDASDRTELFLSIGRSFAFRR